MSPFVSLAAISIVGAFVLSWVDGSVGNPVRSGLIIAVSQILLVDIYYPLGGQRGWLSAVVSAVLLVVGWSLLGIVFGKLSASPPAAEA